MIKTSKAFILIGKRMGSGVLSTTGLHESPPLGDLIAKVNAAIDQRRAA